MSQVLQEVEIVQCRSGCGACCIAPSISSSIPGMKDGKPAGERCIHLTNNNHCGIFGKSQRPVVCLSLKPSQEMCGSCFDEAMAFLESLEKATDPSD